MTMRGVDFFKQYAPDMTEIERWREGAIMDAEVRIGQRLETLRDHYAEQIVKIAKEHSPAGGVLMYLSMFIAAERMRLGPENADSLAVTVLRALERLEVVSPDAVQDLVSGHVKHSIGGRA